MPLSPDPADASTGGDAASATADDVEPATGGADDPVAPQSPSAAVCNVTAFAPQDAAALNGDAIKGEPVAQEVSFGLVSPADGAGSAADGDRDDGPGSGGGCAAHRSVG